MSTNKDQIHFSSKLESLYFHFNRGKNNLFAYFLNRVKWHLYPKFNYISKFPEHVDMELSSACNMRCPMCYTITENYIKNVKRTNMTLQRIEKVLKECGEKNLYSLRLSWRGELTLNQSWIEAIKMAKKYGIKEVSTLTNALLLTPDKFEQMLKAGLDWLTISVDGTGEKYNEIRAPAKFDDLIDKLKKFKEIKKKYNSVKPVIKVQTIWPAIKDNPEEYFSTFRPLVDQVTCNQLVDYLAQDDPNKMVHAPKFNCHVLYQRLTIGADGRILLCYNDEFDKHILGHVDEDSLENVWHGKKMSEARAVHKKNKGIEVYEACKKCFLPREHESFTTVNIGKRKIPIDKLIARSQDVSISKKYKGRENSSNK